MEALCPSLLAWGAETACAEPLQPKDLWLTSALLRLNAARAVCFDKIVLTQTYTIKSSLSCLTSVIVHFPWSSANGPHIFFFSLFCLIFYFLARVNKKLSLKWNCASLWGKVSPPLWAVRAFCANYAGLWRWASASTKTDAMAKLITPNRNNSTVNLTQCVPTHTHTQLTHPLMRAHTKTHTQTHLFSPPLPLHTLPHPHTPNKHCLLSTRLVPHWAMSVFLIPSKPTPDTNFLPPCVLSTEMPRLYTHNFLVQPLPFPLLMSSAQTKYVTDTNCHISTLQKCHWHFICSEWPWMTILFCPL